MSPLAEREPPVNKVIKATPTSRPPVYTERENQVEEVITNVPASLHHILGVTMTSPSIGIIGMGLMGRMYTKRFSEAGYR